MAADSDLTNSDFNTDVRQDSLKIKNPKRLKVASYHTC
jgi:hypothetical protein